MNWELVKTQGHTVYHSCRNHPSKLRLAVSPIDKPNPTRWRWSAYDMTQGSSSGGLLVAEGESGSWPKARIMARLYADRWQADPSIRGRS